MLEYVVASVAALVLCGADAGRSNDLLPIPVSERHARRRWAVCPGPQRTACGPERGRGGWFGAAEKAGMQTQLQRLWNDSNERWQFFRQWLDRKSTRLNSSHVRISCAIF